MSIENLKGTFFIIKFTRSIPMISKMSGTIVWRLKRDDKGDLTFSFQPVFVETMRKYLLEPLIERSILGQMISNNIVTVGDISFIANYWLTPEVAGQADGHFLYYVCEDRTRISEIPLQNSALNLSCLYAKEVRSDSLRYYLLIFNLEGQENQVNSLKKTWKITISKLVN